MREFAKNGFDMGFQPVLKAETRSTPGFPTLA